MSKNPNVRIAALALVIFLFDQGTKLIVVTQMHLGTERVLIPGFFKLVHWGNTGAAWSLFFGNNTALTIVGVIALVILVWIRHHFEIERLEGQISMGLIFGGIVGNLTDRFFRDHVVDFIYFYVVRRNGDEAGFAAFNIADSAICIGVGLLFVLSWRKDERDDRQRGEAHVKG